MEEFEEKVENFVNSVAAFKNDQFFNPWNEVNNDDINGSCEQRCNNLKNFLIDRENAEYVFIGEAPSEGAKYTGIPMTSEEIIEKYNTIFKDIKRTSTKELHKETTAKIIWEKLLNYDETGKNFVIWNAFAFLQKNENGGVKYLKNPKDTLIDSKNNLTILKNFLSLFPKAKQIAIGRTAQYTLARINISYLRHPSCGGGTQFNKDIEKMFSK